ncbi:MAG TPA: spore germination protein [Lachnospiraceae bacterium]|nr:spore germination protein [uncultured Lachnoclostridium sp.]HAU86706.1 spore germination protein [Lachnospiraceae bacterium]
MQKTLTNNFDENLKLFQDILRVDESFDLIYRTITIGGRKAAIFFIDGFVKDEVLQKLMQYFQDKKPEDMPSDAHGFSKQLIPYGEVDLKDNVDDIVTDVLSGVPILIIDEYSQVMEIDCRTYPARSVDEPEKDKTLRGSKDGFVETVVFNTALIRRRIRNPELTMEIVRVGRSSKTDIVISYMNDRVDKKVLEQIRKKLNSIDVDALTMNEESLAECLYTRKWYNPFPKCKFTERPDTTAASILEGSIAIIVDNAPSAMILPATVFDIVEEADDYYFPPITGSYLRISRLIMNILAVLLTPTFLLLFENPDFIPKGLDFIKITDEVNIPIAIQFLILEFAIDGLRLASVNTPNMLSTPLSVVAGIVLGDYTVSSGWFNSEVMLYMAFVAIANYTQVSFELGYALKFLRLILLILTAIFGLWGWIIGIILSIVILVTNKTLLGTSYIYPLIPFNGKKLFRHVFRISLPRAKD